MNSQDVATEQSEKTTLGFWLYLMTDCVLFGALFATFIVLRAYGGVDGAGLFNLPFALIETFILLTSSFACGLALLAARDGQRSQFFGWTIFTFILGASFLGMELYEFNSLILEGHAWSENAFMSGFFTLVATHGLHIIVGLLWLSVLLFRFINSSKPINIKQFALFSLFWHFLDVVWIFIFTIVYLLGGNA